ncbi:hypothetical protein COOONC_26359, partial [Cooperia oncophora]
MREFARGDVVTISMLSNGQVIGPVAVGTALMSSQDMIANKFTGRGVQPLHIYRDFLWEFGSRVTPSPLDLKSLYKVEEPPETSPGEDFPPLTALSVSDQNGDVVVTEAQGKKWHIKPTKYFLVDENSVQTAAAEDNDDDVEEESMDQLLYRCFLAALKYRLDQLPIDVGQFYATCLLKCVPNGKRLEMKRTKYKKFSVFLEEVNKSEDGPVVKIRKEGKGCDMIEEVFKNHPALRSFAVTDEVTKDEDGEPTMLGPK